MPTWNPQVLDRAVESRYPRVWAGLTWYGFRSVRAWLYYGLTLNALALLSVAFDLKPATPGLLIGGTGAFIWAIHRDRQREAAYR